MRRLASVRPTRAAAWFRPALALAVLTVCGAILAERFSAVEPGEVLALVRSIPAPRWAAAIGLTAASFAAIGLYDVAIHRWFRTGVPARRAAISGAASIAVAQIVGLGLVSGTLARWHLLKGLRFESAAGITAAVAASFMVALLVAIAAAGAVAGLPERAPAWLLPAGCAATLAAILLSLAQPRWLRVNLPSLRLMSQILGAAVADTVFAALALWFLLPDPTLLAPAALVPAFMIALGAGLVWGTPAGAGPFELTLLWLLPQVPEPELLAAILAFRLVYFGLPAILGGLVLVVLPGRGGLGAPPVAPTLPLAHAPRAEARLTRLGELDWRAFGPARFAAAETGQSLVALGDPAARRGDLPEALAAFEASARRAGLVPALYKCGARTALAARRRGWLAVHVADEIWLDPRGFSTKGSAHARLRRKLRGADKAGVAVALTWPGNLPVAEMDAVAAAWSDARGGERGFSMGRWSPGYVAGQRTLLAMREGRLVAFATFHDAGHEWTLDLLRTAPEAPDGTMHALIAAAIAEAAARGCPRLSLAALPSSRAAGLAARLPCNGAAGEGLRQFKMAFAPRREPLYLCAPGPLALALAGLDILRRVTRPVPIPSPAASAAEPGRHAAASRSS